MCFFFRANPQKIVSIQRKIEAYLASDIELKESAQRAFQSYLKSVFLLKNKSVFDVFKLDTTAYAASLGLAVPPRVRFLQKQLKMKEEAKARKKAKKPVQTGSDDTAENAESADESDEEEEEVKKPINKISLACNSDGKLSCKVWIWKVTIQNQEFLKIRF